MISLIGSLADNKGALGRRYGEWAVSAPTIESAVAAAAMAQDELGHARSTYPVLAKLGVEREDEGLDAGQPLRVIAHELPDWASVIAANLVVDGILTTFVASARDSSIEPLAQRARKILQEEGAHRVHAEAWLRRMCRGGGSDRELLLTADRRDVGAGRAVAGARRPSPATGRRSQRGWSARARRRSARSVRDWLSRVAARRGRRRRARRSRPTGRTGTRSAADERSDCELSVLRLARTSSWSSPWGGQLITSQVRCRACNTHFEAVRDAFDPPAHATAVGAAQTAGR